MITITETVQVVVVDVAGPHTATEVATAMHKHNPAWKQWVRGCNRAIGDTDRPRNALWKRERVLRKRLARAMRTADRQSRTEKRKNQKWAAVSRSSWKTIWSAWLELKTFPILSKHTKRVLDDWKE